jgi:Integrase core domain
VHPKPIRHLRDPGRYQRSLVGERTRETRRLEQLLEAAQIKLSSPLSDIFGVSGRQLLQALIAGRRNPRRSPSCPRQHAVQDRGLGGGADRPLQRPPRRRVPADAGTQSTPPPPRSTRSPPRSTGWSPRLPATPSGWMPSPGLGWSRQELIAEIGVEMAAPPTAAHLGSWSPGRTSPHRHQSASTTKHRATGRATLAGRNARRDPRRAGTHRHLPWRALPAPGRRRGKQRAIVAVGNSVLTIVWHLLADPRPATEISAPTSTPPRSTSMLLADLGVTKSHSRPHVPDDNPFSESQFKTLKHHPAFPDRFGSIQDARSFCQGFFRWYNHEHYHSGIALLTPADVHSGRARQVTTARAVVLDGAYAAHPERFVRKPPTPPRLPEQVWINKPIDPTEAPQHFPG